MHCLYNKENKEMCICFLAICKVNIIIFIFRVSQLTLGSAIVTPLFQRARSNAPASVRATTIRSALMLSLHFILGFAR